MPFKCFGPIFAIPVSYFALGEVPTTVACAGVLLTVSGAYLMFLEGFSPRALIAPFEGIYRNSGARFMILATLVFPILGTLQKVGAAASSSVFYVSILLVWQFVLYGALLLSRNGRFFAPFLERGAFIVGTSVLWVVGLTAMFAAFEHTLVVYVTAIGQLQPLLTLPIAYVFFGERESKKRVLPAAIMLVGVLAVVGASEV
jgi:drug/metabolite transporter (DMT)-like permease